ncbi:MAG: hypothetical protein R3A48_21940 [Polyangiales bacterium]
MTTRLRRLRIERFRDVTPGTELHFSERWNVVLGRNGTGKTTLLHLISMVLRDDLRALRGEPFAITYDMTLPGGALTVTVENVAQAEPDMRGRGFVATTRVMGREDDGTSWEAVIPEGRPMQIVGEAVEIAPQDPLAAARFFAIGNTRNPTQSSPSSMVFSGGIARDSADRFRIDEGVATFDAIVGVQAPARASVPRRCGVSLLEEIGYISRTFAPPAVGNAMAQGFDPQRPTVEFELGGDPILDRCVRLLGASAITVNAKPLDSDGPQVAGRAFGRFEFYARRGEGRFVHHDRWSFGQQRLFTICWYLSCNPDVVVADELVNGLHWEWIEACVEMIGARQVFVALQNPLLLEHVGIASPEDVRRAFVLCRTSEGEETGAMIWSQPDERVAERFYRAWSTGIQPVHEVLKTEGLW